MVKHSDFLQNKLASSIDLQSPGLEVAPYYQPCVDRKKFPVVYTDYLDNASIKAKAAENPDLADCDIPTIDFVWSPGTPIKFCMDRQYDFQYVVASHVMEHVANPIGWLNDLATVLSDGGRIAIFLPDRRYTGDYRRKETSFAQLLEWWIEQPPAPTVGQVADFMEGSLTLTHDMSVNWSNPNEIDALEHFYSLGDIVSTGTALFNDRPYIDVHCSVWTVDSFKVAFEKASAAGLTSLRVHEVIGDGGEFLAILEKIGEPFAQPPVKKPLADTESSAREILKSIEHQVGVLRHDIGFIIDNNIKPGFTCFPTFLRETGEPTGKPG